MPPAPLHPVWSFLDRPLTLVSRSPRRREILDRLGVPFVPVFPREVPEEIRSGETAGRFVVRVAKEKALSVSAAGEERILVGADTVVVLDGVILTKPTDRADAAGMLGRLSGRTHTVVTGVAVIHEGNGRRASGAEKTRVTFRRLGRGEIDRYVATEEPLDKAGSYAIQGMGGLFVDRIEGCYYNVVGLPVTQLGVRLCAVCSAPKRSEGA